MIEVLKYILLGLIQGIAEVLPISSSGHLLIFEEVLGVNDESLTFEIFLHLASLIAIIAYLWKKLIKLIKGFFLYIIKRDEIYKLDFKYCLYIVISTIPTVIFTLIFKDLLSGLVSKVWFVGIMLIINGALLLIISKINGNRTEKDLNYKDAIVIGLFQSIGILPGISRSGSCLNGAFIRKIDKQTACDYAFVMFVPAVLGATVLELFKFDSITLNAPIWLYLLSFVVTLVTTYFAFKFLLNIIRKGKLKYFSFYCFMMGLFALIYGLIK